MTCAFSYYIYYGLLNSFIIMDTNLLNLDSLAGEFEQNNSLYLRIFGLL